MGKQLSLVYVQQINNVIQFFNKMNGQEVVAVALAPNATHIENVAFVFRVAEGVEEFLEELVDRSIPVNTAHRFLTKVTVVNVDALHKTVHLVDSKRIMGRITVYSARDALNNLSLEYKVASAAEDYVRAIKARRAKKKKPQYQPGQNPRKQDFSALQPKR